MDLVALGTAADIVPMTGENRVITALGFRRLQQSSVAGVRALIAAQNLAGEELNTRHVVFQLAPCINATGRLGDADRGLQMLLTDDETLAAECARDLVAANGERRAIHEQVQNEACAWVEANADPAQDFALVVSRPGWHVGVIGIVASKLVERFYRPSILLSVGDDGMARGSGRSVHGLHLLEALDECADLLEGYGGHAAAAGMSIKAENIDAFRARLNAVVRAKLTLADLAPAVRADCEVPLSSMSAKLVQIIKRMEPFGPGNMRPVFLCRNLVHRYPPRVVGATHLKMSLSGAGETMDAIAFGMGERFPELARARALSVAFTLDENEWNGRISLQMKVKGVEAV
jgi:single-stranded-DNA-specific exonuclease